jgi:hypothetical protein
MTAATTTTSIASTDVIKSAPHSASAAPSTPPKMSRPAFTICSSDNNIRTPPSSAVAARLSSTTSSSFRIVTVPKGVKPGDVIGIALSSGKGDKEHEKAMMGVICPRGVRAGDDIIVLAPGHHRPPISPEEIVNINRRLFARDSDCVEICGGPLTLGEEGEKIEDMKDDVIDSAIIDAFWEVLWPYLRSQGWSCDRQVHFNFGSVNFCPPRPIMESSTLAPIGEDKSEKRDARCLFNSIRDIRAYMMRDDKYTKALADFEADLVRRKKNMTSQQRKQQKRSHQSQPNVEDAWKCLKNRSYIRIGRNFQVTKSLPRAGTHDVSDEGVGYV